MSRSMFACALVCLAAIFCVLCGTNGCSSGSRYEGGQPAAICSQDRMTSAQAPGEMQGGEAPQPGTADDAEQGFDREAYDRIYENPFLAVGQNPYSTFSIDVDSASYSNTRRFLRAGTLPPRGAVRIEELVNYFFYDYQPPRDEAPFAVHVEIADCPWKSEHRLARVAIKGREIAASQRPNSNFVFLLDVSGSMEGPNRLPLLRDALKMLVEKLGARDRVAIVVYAGSSGVVLPSTPCTERSKITEALDKLQAGGSTNAGEGIQAAYSIAQANFIQGGVNRVLLATDGDFNVGVTSQDELIRMIEEKAKGGVYLTVLGFGMGNYQDSTLEKIADKGNGNYAYIDTIHEARKVLIDQMSGTLVTIAQDVKLQVEFNPALVSAYRLIGYENRMLRTEDFLDETKDAGEIGAGHTVTAFYELVPVGGQAKTGEVAPLRYQSGRELTEAAKSGESFTLRIRYKRPGEATSQEMAFPIADSGSKLSEASGDYKFAAAVAAFGMLLRDSEHKGNATFDTVESLAREGCGEDRHGYRREFLELVPLARNFKSRQQ